MRVARDPDRRHRADAGDRPPADCHPPRSATRSPRRRVTPLVKRSASRASPARVRDAMPCTNTGPITPRAATSPISGHGGPFHTCTMRTSVPSAIGSKVHSTSMPVVTPRTCRKRIDGGTAEPGGVTDISDVHHVGQFDRAERPIGRHLHRAAAVARVARESERSGSAPDAIGHCSTSAASEKIVASGARTTLLVDRRHAPIGRHRAEVVRRGHARAGLGGVQRAVRRKPSRRRTRGVTPVAALTSRASSRRREPAQHRDDAVVARHGVKARAGTTRARIRPRRSSSAAGRSRSPRAARRDPSLAISASASASSKWCSSCEHITTSTLPSRNGSASAFAQTACATRPRAAASSDGASSTAIVVSATPARALRPRRCCGMSASPVPTSSSVSAPAAASARGAHLEQRGAQSAEQPVRPRRRRRSTARARRDRPPGRRESRRRGAARASARCVVTARAARSRRESTAADVRRAPRARSTSAMKIV